MFIWGVELSQQSISKKSSEVSEMFGSIAKRYDLLNSVLSLRTHKYWQSRFIKALPIKKEDRVLDLCTGTGALLGDLKSKANSVVGADFCLPMLENGNPEELLLQADALHLPFADQSFDGITIAYGVRNFEDLALGLTEIRRVLKPGGWVGILEFGQPKGIIGKFYSIYSSKILPVIGGIISGNKKAYSYLQKTSMSFPCGEAFTEALKRAGFKDTHSKSLTFGVAYIYLASKE